MYNIPKQFDLSVNSTAEKKLTDLVITQLSIKYFLKT